MIYNNIIMRGFISFMYVGVKSFCSLDCRTTVQTCTERRFSV